MAVNCEGGKVKFKDHTAKQEYVEQFCASHCGWRGCSVAKNLNDYYERSLKA